LNKLRTIAGLVAGIILILSSGAHSILGWTTVSGQLAAVHIPADLTTGLKMAWFFGGMTTLALGIIVVILFLQRLRGQLVSKAPALVIAIGQLAFGVWALAITNLDPFGFVFIVPGVLLAIAAL
jgi:hypothetical protein